MCEALTSAVLLCRSSKEVVCILNLFSEMMTINITIMRLHSSSKQIKPSQTYPQPRRMFVPQSQPATAVCAP